MNTDKTSQLAHAPLGRLLFSLAVPSIIAQLVNILYNIVDRMYIGRMANGTLAMSAISVSMPIVTFVLAVTMLFGAGGAPIAAIRLGQDDKPGAEKILTNSFTALIVSGLIMTIIIEVFHEPLLMTFGADASNIGLASDYIMIYGLGTIAVQLAFGLNPYITTQGFATLGMVTVLIGAVLNIVLDPILIFTLNMGVKGAALATIISQFISAIWACYFLRSKKSIIKIRMKYLMPDWKILGSICALGMSPFIMNATESLLQISFNNQLSLYGGTLAVGTMSILQSLFQMSTLPLQGLCQGAQPIMSYNYGAGNLERVRKTFRLLFVTSLSFSIIVIGTIMIFSRFFASLFTGDPELLLISGWAIRIYMAGAMLFGAQISCQQSFVALGQAKQSLLMALFRKVLLLIPLLYIMPGVIGGSQFAYEMGLPVSEIVSDHSRVFAVLVSESIADILAAITTTALFFSFYKKTLTKKQSSETN